MTASSSLWERVINGQVSPDTVSLLNHCRCGFSNKKWQINLTKFRWTKKYYSTKKRSIFQKVRRLDKNITTNLNRESFLTRSFNRPNALGFMQNPPGFKELKIFKNCNFFPPFFFWYAKQITPHTILCVAPACHNLEPTHNPTYFREICILVKVVFPPEIFRFFRQNERKCKPQPPTCLFCSPSLRASYFIIFYFPYKV